MRVSSPEPNSNYKFISQTTKNYNRQRSKTLPNNTSLFSENIADLSYRKLSYTNSVISRRKCLTRQQSENSIELKLNYDNNYKVASLIESKIKFEEDEASDASDLSMDMKNYFNNIMKIKNITYSYLQEDRRLNCKDNNHMTISSPNIVESLGSTQETENNTIEFNNNDSYNIDQIKLNDILEDEYNLNSIFNILSKKQSKIN